MIINQKQIFKLLQLSTGYLELLSILDSKQIIVNESLAIRSAISNLHMEISNQQPEKLMEIK